MIPKIALIGRPNVGKSALFNRICKERISIVDEQEGVTRDRLYVESELFGKRFRLIDTGGIGKGLPFCEEVRRQSEIAIGEADSLIMVVDAHVGVTQADKDVARQLLKEKKPLCLAVNKVDKEQDINLIHQFHELGIQNMMAVSAVHGFQMAELLAMALEPCPEAQPEVVSKNIKVAILGRPNVGKSTLLNQLIHEERSCVSPVAGTTRDHIDALYSVNGTDYLFIDTAGIRKKQKESDVIDKYAAIRTQRAIQRSDVCLVVIDVTEGMTSQEKNILHHIQLEGKGCIILLNKWDLVKAVRMEHVIKALKSEIPFLEHSPMMCISALTGRGVPAIYETIKEVYAGFTQRISTGQLNQFVEKTVQKYHPPMIQGKRLRIYYMTQVDVCPPRFLLFVNDPKRIRSTYQTYLMNQFRENYPFSGVPFRFTFKGKKERELHEKIDVTS